jgi:hypothetical protein
MTHSPHNLSDGPGAEDRLIQAHLASELDRHLGTARRRFEATLGEETHALPQPIRLHEHRSTGWNWRWSLGLVAAAASVTIAIGLWGLFEAGRPVEPVMGPIAEGSGHLTPMEYSESWESQDLGMYEFEGRPVRAVHQEQWERTRYRDAKGYQVQIEEPRSRLVLVDAPVQ